MAGGDDSTDDYPATDDGAYACGTVVSGQKALVLAEYSTWKSKYIVASAKGLCVARPQQGGDCVSEVKFTQRYPSISKGLLS